MTFTTANWNTPQTVTLSAAEDADTVNGTAVFAVASSGLTSIDVNASEADNDTQSLIVSTTSVSVNEGSTNTFHGSLGSSAHKRCDRQCDAYIGRHRSIGKRRRNFDVYHGELEYPSDRDAVGCREADTVNGTAIFSVASSGLTSVNVNATEADNDTQSLIVSTTSVSVNEGSTNTFTVRLAAQPTSDVTVNVTAYIGRYRSNG